MIQAAAERHWTEGLRAAWRPLPRMGGAEWAERARWLGREETSSPPGPMRLVPWQREILDALADPLIEWLVILKAAQMGCSELVRCAIGRWALHDPGDVLWVMTTQHAAKKAMKKLRTMFRNTPALRPLVSARKRDSTLLEMVLTNGMRIVIGWAGSAQSLASDPFRYVILDEVAKYRWSVQGEGSPVDLAKERTKTFGRRGKIVLLSSPKSDDDLICSSHRECTDRRVFAVQCPTCHHLQPAEFDRVRWPGQGGEPQRAPTDPDVRVRLADEIERDQSAWMACVDPACEGRLQPARAQHGAGSRWVQEEPVQGSRRRAYHVPELFHWETSLSDLAAKFLRATSPRAQQGFTNGSLGRAHRSEQTPIDAASIAARAIHPPGIVPTWAVAVLSTADTQQGGWWLMVRAWGRGGRSRLLDWGWIESEAELVERGLAQRFPLEEGGGEVSPEHLAVDTGGGMETEDGSRTKDVYELARRVPGVVLLKGEPDRGPLETPWRQGKAGDVALYLVNRTFYADEAAALIRARPVLWEECRGAEHPNYSRQMASEKRVQILSDHGSEWRWVKRSTGAANHLWDCARYQVWLADLLNLEQREPWAPWQLPQNLKSVRTRY